MSIKIKFKIHPEDRYTLEELYKRIKKLAQGHYMVYICDSKPRRSMQQNAYYHAVVLPLIASEVGYTKDELHEALKIKFLPKIIRVKGEPHTVGKKTSILTTKEFSQYLEQVIQMALDLGIYIPEANKITDETIVQLENR